MCIFHKWRFIGYFYEEYTPTDCNNYGLKCFKVYSCNKCKKEKMVLIDQSKDIFLSMHVERVRSLERKGYKDIVTHNMLKIENGR